MKRKCIILLVLPAVMLTVLSGCASGLPDGFVYVTDVVKTAQLDIRYYGDNNFVGTRIDGYEAPVAILTKEAAKP